MDSSGSSLSRSSVRDVVWQAMVLAILGSLSLLLLRRGVRSLRQVTRNTQNAKLPPGPWNLPVIGALHYLEPNLPRSLMKLAKRYGPVIYLKLGKHNMVVVSTVKGAEEVLRLKDTEFSNRPNTTTARTAAKYVGFDRQSIVFRDYDEKLKLLRKICTSEFFTSKKLSEYEKVRKNEGAIMIEGIMRRAENGICPKVHIKDSFLLMNTDIMCMLLFSKRYSDAISSEIDELKMYPQLGTRFAKLIHQFNLIDFFPALEWFDPQGILVQYEDYQNLCRKCYGPIIEEHRQARKTATNYEDRDFVDHLLTLEEDGQLSENGIMGCIIDMLSGGIETGAVAAQWTLLELVKRPETMARLREEIDGVVGNERQVEESDFANLPFLEAVVKESLRLHSPGPILLPRCNKVANTIGGYFVPANTTVIVNAYAISRDPDVWENPDDFAPDRFGIGGSNAKFSVAGINCQYIPFGSGRRICVAFNLGMLLIQRMVATMVHSFDWGPPPGKAIEDISSAEGTTNLNELAEDLVLSARPREAANAYRRRNSYN